MFPVKLLDTYDCSLFIIVSAKCLLSSTFPQEASEAPSRHTHSLRKLWENTARPGGWRTGVSGSLTGVAGGAAGSPHRHMVAVHADVWEAATEGWGTRASHTYTHYYFQSSIFNTIFINIQFTNISLTNK